MLLALLVLLLISTCNPYTKKDSYEKWKNEILETEQNFATMAKEEGISEAFLNYAAEDAVLMRNNTLVVGKKGITEFFENQSLEDNEISLTWKPDFVDVAASGDLGYTYGKYIFSITDSSGIKRENSGISHTVWKKQPDGTWQFVWD